MVPFVTVSPRTASTPCRELGTGMERCPAGVPWLWAEAGVLRLWCSILQPAWAFGNL